MLDALDAIGFRGDGRLLPLGSYENRVYQIWRDDGPPVVAKFYRPGRWTDEQIREEHAFVAELARREIPVVAPLAVNGDDAPRRRRVPRRRVPEVRRSRARARGSRDARVAGPLPRPHPRGRRDDVLSLAGRRSTSSPSASRRATSCCRTTSFPRTSFPRGRSIAALALEGVRRAYDRAGDVRLLRLHGDCHAGNVLWTDGGPHFVDFDDARSGPAVQDLWMLLSGDRAAMSQALAAVLDGYEDFAEFDPRELHLVEALRTLRLLHYSAWLAMRWDDPAFPAAFPWFGTQRYWQDRILELREQVALMDEPPLVV